MILVFDLDGTLITCKERQLAVLRYVLGCEKLHSFDLGKLWTAKRNGAATWSALVQQGLPLEAARRISGVWANLVEGHYWLGMDRCFFETRPLLSAFRRAGGDLRLLTARRDPYAVRAQLRRLGIDQLFEVVAVVAPSKAAEQKAEMLSRWRPAAFIGDTESDAAAALAAAVPFRAVNSGQRSARYLSEAGIASYDSLGSAAGSLIDCFSALSCPVRAVVPTKNISMEGR